MATVGLCGGTELSEVMTVPFGQSEAPVSTRFPPPGYLPGCICLSNPWFKMWYMALGQKSMGRAQRVEGFYSTCSPKNPQTWRLAEIFLKSICVPHYLEISIWLSASKLLLAPIHSISSRLGFLIGICTSSGLIL